MDIRIKAKERMNNRSGFQEAEDLSKIRSDGIRSFDEAARSAARSSSAWRFQRKFN